MIPIRDALRVRRIWELAGRPACSHAGIDVVYDPDLGGATGALACRACGNIWLLDPEPFQGVRPPRTAPNRS
jgi:hypothetical protein